MTTYYVLNNEGGHETSVAKFGNLTDALISYREHMAYCEPILVRKLEVELFVKDDNPAQSADISLRVK